MLPRISFLLQLRGKYHRATRDYMHLSRALDEAQLSPTTRSVLGAGAGASALNSRKRAAGDQGGLNSLDDDKNGRQEGDYDNLAHGRRLGAGNGRFQGGGGQRTQEEEEELRMIRSEEYEKRKEIKEIVKGIRAQILFRKIPLTLSRIERLLAPMRRPNKVPQPATTSGKKRKLKKTKKTKTLSAEASGPAAHPSIVPNLNPNTTNMNENSKLSADDEEMLDMMFMGFEDSVAGVGEGLVNDTALVESSQLTTVARTEEDRGNTIEKRVDEEEEGAADDFLFAGESVNGLSSSLDGNGVKTRVPPTPAMKRRTTLQQHVSLANVTRFLDTLGYFEGQRELFLSQQMAEYAKAKSEINNQIHMRHRRLAKEHSKSTKGIVHTMRTSLKQVVAADAKMAGLKQQLADVEEKERVLNASLIARPYTSARLWMAVLRFPALPSEGGPNREVDPSLRLPYARALAKMLSGIMRVIAKNGSGNAINEESPRFVATLSPSSISKSKKLSTEGRSGVEGGWARHCEDVSKQHSHKEGGIMSNEAAEAIEMLIESPASSSSTGDAVVLPTESNANNNTNLVIAEKSSDKIAGWIPSPSRSATELLLLSLVRLSKVFEAIADDCKLLQQQRAANDYVDKEGGSRAPLASAAAAVHLSETLVRCQKIATGLLVAVNDTIKARERQGIKLDPHTKEVLLLVGPTLTTLDKSMTELGAAVVASFLPPMGSTSGMTAAAATASALVPNAARQSSLSPHSSVSSSAYLNMFAHQNFIESLKPQSALLLISRLYQLKCFHPDTPKESRKLLYALIQKAFPQTANRTRNTLIREGNTEDLKNFISDEQKAVMRRKGMSYRDILDDPVKEAKLQQKRMDALLKSKRLEQLEQAQAEMIAVGVPLNDLLQAYECLSFAAMNAGIGALQAGRGGRDDMRGVDSHMSPIHTEAFKPVSKEAMSWSEMLDFAVPHLAEAIVTRAAADKQLAIKMSEEDRASSSSPLAESTDKSAAAFAAGLNMLQLVKLLKLSSPLLEKIKAESHRSSKINIHQRRSGTREGMDSSSTAFYLFALSELKVKLSARLHQEVAKREAKERSMNVHNNKNDSAVSKNSRNNTNKKLESADDLLLRSIDEQHALASGNTVPPLSPYAFAGIVNVTGEIMRGIRHATSPAVHNAARDLQQICKAMLIEDDELLNALRPLVREDSGASTPPSRNKDGSRDHRGETGSSAPSRGHHHSDVYASIIEGFEMSKVLTPEFHSYLTNVL